MPRVAAASSRVGATANTRLICSCSSSSRLESVDSWIGCGVLGAKITSERSSLRMTVPRLKTTARSTTLRSSLMLPGHEYGIRAFLASSENWRSERRFRAAASFNNFSAKGEYVVLMFAQCRDAETYYVEPVIQVSPETAGRDLLL